MTGDSPHWQGPGLLHVISTGAKYVLSVLGQCWDRTLNVMACILLLCAKALMEDSDRQHGLFYFLILIMAIRKIRTAQ